jgi:hypothetical protein
MKNFKQLRNPEIPLPKKIPGTIGKQHERIIMLLDEVASGKRTIPETSKAPLPYVKETPQMLPPSDSTPVDEAPKALPPADSQVV